MNFIFRSLCFIFFLIPTLLHTIEGYEPDDGIELLLPEIKFKKVSAEFPSTLKFPSFSIYSQFGKGIFGDIYEICMSRKDINNILGLEFIKIKDRYSTDVSIGARRIGNADITEGIVKIGGYKIDNRWHSAFVFELEEKIFIGNSTLKIISACGYESKFIGDYGILWGVNYIENIFVGAGVSGPDCVPFVQVNGFISDNFLFNASHRSKRVTGTLKGLHVQYPFVLLTPTLKHERWNISTLKAEIGNIVSIELKYKEIEDAIFWHLSEQKSGFSGGALSPIRLTNNPEKYYEFKTMTELVLPIFKIRSFLMHSRRKWYNGLYPLYPEILLNNGIEIAFPLGIKIELENEYLKGRLPLSDYSTFAITVLRQFGYAEILCRVNNITNVKYEIVDGVKNDKICVLLGFNIIF